MKTYPACKESGLRLEDLHICTYTIGKTLATKQNYVASQQKGF